MCCLGTRSFAQSLVSGEFGNTISFSEIFANTYGNTVTFQLVNIYAG